MWQNAKFQNAKPTYCKSDKIQTKQNTKIPKHKCDKMQMCQNVKFEKCKFNEMQMWQNENVTKWKTNILQMWQNTKFRTYILIFFVRNEARYLATTKFRTFLLNGLVQMRFATSLLLISEHMGWLIWLKCGSLPRYQQI